MSSIDFGYFAYLASNVPPLDLARAIAVRAKRALRGRIRQVLGPVARHPALRPPFFMQVPPEQRYRRVLRGSRPSIVDHSLRELTAGLLRERFPEACRFVLREADASRRGEVAVFGKWKDCRKRSVDTPGADAAPLDYHLDPIGHGVRYDPSIPGTRIDHFVAGADVKAAWEIGRLQQLWRYGQARWLARTATERSAWARAYMATVRQFRADCPLGMGVQWSCPMEVASRAFHVALSFAYVEDDAAVDAAFVSELTEMLDEHCTYVEEHLEETGAVRTNHYAADLVGLVVVGSLFPELPRARIWREVFGRKLWEEIPRQVRPDGTHFESSTGYQRLTAELFLGAVLAARAAGIPPPHEVELAVAGLFRSIGKLLKPSGLIPQIGDLDSCRGLPLMPRAALDCGYLPALGAAALGDPSLKLPGAPCPVEVAWLLGASGVERFDLLPARGHAGSALLPEAGVAVLRRANAYLCLTAGPNGQGGCGGHAHNDKNSVELSFGEVDLALDRGTFVYARDPADRDARRGTAAHSTVQVDGAEQNRIIPGRLFALPDISRARIRWMERRNGFEMASGEHVGYQRLAQGVLHRRLAALRERFAAFQDELLGSGAHLLEARWIVPHTDV
ncbi:MAG TPA: alginate lyase family protein, partial [Myxococcales bacterium]|nr:alginate lyase family protein [Myxococcales bacterium]